MLRSRSLVVVPSLARPSSLFSFFFIKFPLVPSCNTRRPPLCYHTSPRLFPKPLPSNECFPCLSVNKMHLSTLTAAATQPIHGSSASLPADTTLSSRARKKARRESPEGVLRHKLDICSKNGDVAEALRLYEEARGNGVPLSQHHYNVLLYLCSSSDGVLGLEKGFEIFRQMVTENIVPNEATFTSAARLAAAREDPEMALDLVQQMKGFGIAPRLRSYGPALFGFCEKGLADRAYAVDADMVASGVVAEEAELSAILKVSVDARRADKVYEIMHRLRATVRQVSETTAGIVEGWFKCEEAAKVGEEAWDVSKVREGIVRGGGGWHGQGWLGSGDWRLTRTRMDETGVCGSCGAKLVCIDIEPKETQNFASSLTNLACKREVRADFVRFQDWLQQHGPFEAVVDGANVGLINQHSFNFFQLNTIVKQLRQMSPSNRLPLIILHKNRVTGGPAQHPNNKILLETWKKSGALYATPPGSNDDWYWLYAAVSCKCLLVTNDEMRDHLFQLLGTSFFPRWKEKHQVRLSFSHRGAALHMPPPYSIVIQESEKGSWHVPTTTGDDLETPRLWLCATRAKDASSSSSSHL
ncbi:proteinaceous RNase P 1, chloroplastic/mitochondrial-like [Corylus avellana]|uniref:proteinaceous RNase P 1, chloroplastic/mitochondrial-like n=1 Tax=Corylus avellana TaxID=13451 RepID=UPI00286BD0B7|nr:proteinaceous RNase P 1, chloroplastic/mitochondrial-like [Corylus avellana]